MSDKRILIKETFNEQYTLLIEMESKMIDAFLKTKTMIRYDFTILDVQKNHFDCRLIQLEINVIESNNDLVKEISAITAAFNRMFNEMHLRLDNEGQIIEILNLDLILHKWKQTKEEMERIMNNDTDLKNIISTNDNLFANPQKIKEAIKGNEFLQTYFGHIFGVKIPFSRTISGTNIFNTAFIDWNYIVETTTEEINNIKEDNTLIRTKSIPTNSLSKKFNKQAYSQFSEKLDIESLSASLEETSVHLIDNKSGRLIQSLIKRSEKSHNDLYMYIKYRIINEQLFLKNKDKI